MKEPQKLKKTFQTGRDENATVAPSPTQENPALFVVPAQARNLKLTDLPLSVRLDNVLLACGYQVLGDLNGVTVENLLSVKNCGRKCILELTEIIHRAAAGEFSPVEKGDRDSNIREIVSAIDDGMEQISARNRKIYQERLSGKNGAPRTLEDVGSQFQLTRERTRQIVEIVNEKIRRTGGLRLAHAIKAIARECQKIVCPLTPELLAKWFPDSPSRRRIPQFYVGVISQLDQTVLAWPAQSGGDHEGRDLSQSVGSALETWMRSGGLRPTTQQAYSEICRHPAHRNLSVEDFLGAIRRYREILINFSEPDLPVLELRRSRLRTLEFARPVLESSPKPLTLDEIMEQGKARFGEDARDINMRELAGSLTAKNGFFLLGPCTIGLAKHLKIPMPRRREFCNQFEELLKQRNRPVSTTMVGDNPLISEFAGMNSYEMAQILREDSRFTDLGRRLFALREVSSAKVRKPVKSQKQIK